MNPSTLRRRAIPAVLLVAALAVLVGCPSGYVTTSTGATVPAATVSAQDLVGDALQTLQDAHNASVAAHDALFGKEPADVHAARRAKLLTNAAGLRTGWDALTAWKMGSEGAGMVAVASVVRGTLPDLLRIAVDLKVLPQGTADIIGAFFGTAVTGTIPTALPKQGGTS